VVSATRDAEHRTVIDLIEDPDRESLHLVGRLDRNTTGLVLLTNDGRWSKRLMDPMKKVPKVYRVATRDLLESEYRRGLNDYQNYLYLDNYDSTDGFEWYPTEERALAANRIKRKKLILKKLGEIIKLENLN
jgi:pseudouridine synthase